MNEPCCICLLLGTGNRNHGTIIEGFRSYLEEHDLGWHLYRPVAGVRPGTMLGDTPMHPPIHAVVSGYGQARSEWEAYCGRRRLPRVRLIGSGAVRSERSHLGLIGTDDAAIGGLAADHAAAAGYRHAAIIGQQPLSQGGERLAAYLARCAEHGMHTAHWLPDPDGVDPIADQRRWLQEQREPTALFFHQDLGAAWWRDYLAGLGLAVPQRFGLIGVDNDETVCTSNDPGLTSVDLPYRHIGRTAACMLHRLLAGEPAPEQGQRMRPLRVVARRSTDLTLSRLVTRAMAHMRRKLRRPVAVADLARKLGVSRATLWRAFARDLDASPQQVQLRLRLERATELLLTDNRPLACIASDCGFDTLGAFRVAFRRRYGEPPGRFRSMGQHAV